MLHEVVGHTVLCEWTGRLVGRSAATIHVHAELFRFCYEHNHAIVGEE